MYHRYLLPRCVLSVTSGKYCLRMSSRGETLSQPEGVEPEAARLARGAAPAIASKDLRVSEVMLIILWVVDALRSSQGSLLVSPESSMSKRSIIAWSSCSVLWQCIG